MKTRSLALFSGIVVMACLPVQAQTTCRQVGGVLMTNIGAIDGTYNLGPVFGDLKGSVAAKILGQNNDGSFTVQHYWVTDSGDTILLKPAILKPIGDSTIVGVIWGNYISDISGGTGAYAGATGQLSYFGLADFKELTLVLRYRGQVCTQTPK